MFRWIVPAAAALCLAGYVFVYATGRASQPIRSDGFSYYVYLPSWFLYHDTTLTSVARDCCGGDYPAFTAIIRWPGTRRWVDAHPMGVAVMQTPLFLVAHALTRWSNLSPDGFSLYYQHAAGVAGLAWVIAGLWVLRDLLRRHFSERVTAATLLTVLLATNLYHYATFDSSYSHPYSFFLFAALLNLTDRWHRERERRPVVLGVIAGLIVLVRHTNVLGLVVFLLYGVVDRPTLREAWTRLLRERREVAKAAAVAAAVIVPQLALYYGATGRLLVSSYGSLGFDFTSPHVLGVLFSVQKGLFFWSPILLLAVAGLLVARGTARAFALPSLLFLAANTYLVASWWDWQFGASYGHRGFVDSLPMFSIGLAAVYARATSRFARCAITAIACAAVALSVIQMLQYWNGVLPFSDTTWEQYRGLFLRLR
jgi:hypothetical protein